ncbi:hypothetical protein CFC21_003811 [Triticum aestivum]|uniref:Uncharacterized protein n=1 Tax=Triticum aestivum TaxID=4565 RepID=A0A3B5Y5W0_WHEAT|nr:hypothetical protein CFC21_003811 [Triticum aestivum]
MLLQGCSRTRGHGYHSSTWSCSCGLFISNNAIKPSEVPRRFPFAAPLFGFSRMREPLCVCMLIWSWNSSLIYYTSGNKGSVHAQSSVASSHKNFYIVGWIGYSQNFIPYTLGIAETTECQRYMLFLLIVVAILHLQSHGVLMGCPTICVDVFSCGVYGSCSSLSISS